MSIEKAKELIEKKDRQAALPYLEAAAKAGDAWAQGYLGWMYDTGSGVAQNRVKALSWFEKAALQGNKTAQYNLGVSYETGSGVAKDLSAALQWYEKAAAQGYKDAQDAIKRVKQKTEAEKAKPKAKTNEELAKEYLKKGDLYRNGVDVEQDFQQAIYWYEQAVQQGNLDAYERLGYVYRNYDNNLRSDAKAFSWMKKGAEAGNISTQYRLGIMYAEGTGTAKDTAAAVFWLKKAADKGLDDAKTELEKLEYAISQTNQTAGNKIPTKPTASSNNSKQLWMQLFLNREYEKAFPYIEAAANAGDLDAQGDLGWMYVTGNGVAKDTTKGVVMLRKTGEKGCPIAQHYTNNFGKG